MTDAAPTPTETLYSELMTAYRFFNAKLFDDRLPDCLVTLQRTPGHVAALSAHRFVDNDLNRFTSELSIHPGYFATQSLKTILSNLVHEMVHLEVVIDGTENSAKTPGYHSSDWGSRMERIGLIPSESGLPGGRKTGFRMNHYVYEGGPFDTSSDDLLATGWRLTWIDRVAEEMKPQGTDAPPALAAQPNDESQAPESTNPETSTDLSASTPDIERAAPPTNAQVQHDDADGTAGRSTPEEPAVPPMRADANDSTPAKRQAFSRVRLARREAKGGKRDKYVCNGCKNAVWGKPKLHVICGDCEQRMQSQGDNPQ